MSPPRQPWQQTVREFAVVLGLLALVLVVLAVVAFFVFIGGLPG